MPPKGQAKAVKRVRAGVKNEPKTKARKPAAKAKAEPAPQAIGPRVVPQSDPATHKLNHEHFAQLAAALSTLQQHAGANLHQQAALALQLEAFDARLMEIRIRTSGSYVCNASLLWCKAFWTANSGVPVNQGVIRKYISELLAEQVHTVVSRVFKIGVMPDDNMEDGTAFGNLHLLSPEEPYRAMILACFFALVCQVLRRIAETVICSL